MSRSILTLPPALQAVWTAVYAAVLGAREGLWGRVATTVGAAGAYAEERAWEAVRRANGGELPATNANLERTRALVEGFADIMGDGEKGPPEFDRLAEVRGWRIQWSNTGHSGPGWYASSAEYSDEGAEWFSALAEARAFALQNPEDGGPVDPKSGGAS